MNKIDQLIKEALLAKDKIALNAYKNLKTELQKVLTAKNAPEYSEALFIQVAAKYAKSLEDAILQFSEAHRDDLVTEYTSELEVVKKLLPEPINEQQICYFIENDENFFDKFWVTVEDENNEEYRNGGEGNHMEIQIPKKEMGTAIKYLKSIFPTADGKIISEIVKRYVI